MKKSIVVLLLFVMLFSFAAVSAADVRVGVVLPIGGRGDNSLGDGTYDGVLAAQQVLDFEFDYSEPTSEQDREAMLLEYADSEEYDLIIAAGSEMLTLVQAIGEQYPDQKFLVYDISGNLENAVTEWYNKAEMGFMAGVFMALMDPYGEVEVNGENYTWTPSGKFGLIIGGEYPSTVTAMTGAAAGMKYIDPNNEYMYGIVGNWTDQAKNKELAASMYSEGCNFVFHNAGGASAGIVSAATEAGRFMIGYDANQNHMSATNILASSHKAHTNVMTRVLTQFIETGELPWGEAEENSYANDGIAFTLNDGVVIPEEVSAVIADVQNKIMNNEIDVPETWDEVAAFTEVYSK